eukprot:m.67669 g.67669  ORF g.67669 m.67669 type:complete len:57 (-) comp8224_c0_seq4:1375-1545(-)
MSNCATSSTHSNYLSVVSARVLIPIHIEEKKNNKEKKGGGERCLPRAKKAAVNLIN